MIPRRDSDFIAGRRGQALSGVSTGYEVVKSCRFKISGSDNLPKRCGEPMKYSVKRKTWYCPIHGAQGDTD